MSIRFDPKVGATLPTNNVTQADSPAPQKSSAPPKNLEAMDKPKPLSTPDSSRTRPDPRHAPVREPEIKQTVAQLQALLRGDPSQRLSAAQLALAQAASFALRRSKGARQQAIDLCDSVATQAPELAQAARLIKGALTAEGLLQAHDPESTLRAIRGLVEMLSELDPDA